MLTAKVLQQLCLSQVATDSPPAAWKVVLLDFGEFGTFHQKFIVPSSHQTLDSDGFCLFWPLRIPSDLFGSRIISPASATFAPGDHVAAPWHGRAASGDAWCA